VKQLGDYLNLTPDFAAIEPSPERLRELPPTEKLAAIVAGLRADVDATPEAMHYRRLKLIGDLAHAERRLEWGYRRDELIGNRPAGCWCLGAGGRHKSYLSVDCEIPAFREYCTCPDGEAAEAAARTEAARLQSDWDARIKERQAERLAGLWQDAGIPPIFHGLTLDSFPVVPATALIIGRLWDWLETDRWLVLWGENGVGKSGLSSGLLWELGQRGQSVLFQPVGEILARLKQTYSRENGRDALREHEVMGALMDVDVLVLDDFGTEYLSDSGWAAAELFRLINHRHDHLKRTIITSNLAPSALAARLGDKQGARIMWRVIELSKDWVIKVDGPNLRDGR